MTPEESIVYASSPTSIRCRFWSSTSMPSARTSPAPKKSKRAMSSTKRVTKLSGPNPLSLCKPHGPSSSSTSPRSVDATDKAQEAIKALNPLCTCGTLRTHRYPYNLVYRLDPVRAFELKWSSRSWSAKRSRRDAAQRRFVRVEQVDQQKGHQSQAPYSYADSGRAKREIGHGETWC